MPRNDWKPITALARIGHTLAESHTRDVEGYSNPAVRGLSVTPSQHTDHAQKTRWPWVVTHTQSGLMIPRAEFASLAIACAVAEMLAECGDWTREYTEICAGRALVDDAREIVGLPRLASAPKPEETTDAEA